MAHPIRSLLVTGALVALGTAVAGCGSSGGSDAAPTTKATAATTTTTAAATTTTEATTTTTTSSSGSTTTAVSGGPVDCQALLQEYTEQFDPDNLSGAVAFFRTYEPSMPDDVAAASERLAAAYEKAGDLGHMDMADVDLTADAQTFSDWTNDGCPAG